MIITEQDYKRVIGEAQLKAVTQADAEARQAAELEAEEEMAGYRRSRFNTQAIFSAQGKERNPIILMYLCDIALYHLSASMPQRIGTEVRKERYERAIRWLEGVQQGKIVPSLPAATAEGTDTPAAAGTMTYNSEPKLNNNW